MKKVLFINPAIYLPGEKAIKRTFYLFDMMRRQGMKVHFLTSDFNHYEKKERNTEEFLNQYPEYKEDISFVHMPPYKKNISIGRYMSNLYCDRHLLKWFERYGRDYDVVYISWPASYLTRKIKKFCDLYHVKLILDINDLWPDSLKLILKNDSLYNITTFFMRKNTEKAYSYADGLVAVSEEYLLRAMKHNSNLKFNLPVYIGAMLERFDKGVRFKQDMINKQSNQIWITYIGTIGRSYDFETVMKAVALIRTKENIDIRFKILGKGPEEKRLIQISKSLKNSATDFEGFLEYELMAAFLSKSDICVNCIKQRASQSIINKVSDYFAAGKPVINCGPCKEMENLIDDYQCGINYEAENVEACVAAIMRLLNNPQLMEKYGYNSRKLAEEKFDREKTHQKIINMIEEI